MRTRLHERRYSLPLQGKNPQKTEYQSSDQKHWRDETKSLHKLLENFKKGRKITLDFKVSKIQKTAGRQFFALLTNHQIGHNISIFIKNSITWKIIH